MKFNKLYLILLLLILIVPTLVLHILDNSVTIAPQININTATKFKTYVEKNTYSISYPSTWIVDRSSRELVIFYNQKLTGNSEELPLNLVKTDITVENISFNEKINIYKDAAGVGLGNEIAVKEEKLNIGGTEAYRRWFEIDQKISSVHTLFKNNNQVISVSTFINPNNPKALPIIYQTHNSLRLLKTN